MVVICLAASRGLTSQTNVFVTAIGVLVIKVFADADHLSVAYHALYIVVFIHLRIPPVWEIGGQPYPSGCPETPKP
jgi:hypothetical protein